MTDCYRLTISLGCVCQAEQIVADALQVPCYEAAEAIQKEAFVHMDETSHRVSGKCAWMWIALCSQLAVFYARSTRSKPVAQEILGSDFSGTLISDRYGAYHWVSSRQFCWAHLIRDFRKFQEIGGPCGEHADKIMAYVKKMFSLWHEFKDDKLKRSELQKQMKPICLKIEFLLLEGTDLLLIDSLCRSLYNGKDFLWNFIRMENIEPTNNYAERTLRQCVIWRKNSFGTQSERGNRFVERILTVVSTCKLQGRKPLDYVSEAVRSYLSGHTVPSLLPAQTV